ncbi:MAG: hypothetical protein ISP76_05200 [Burkholderiales bacterium]|nr:hypothetical protein [Burkholderiales bacterium]
MNTFEFFNQNFGGLLVRQDDDPYKNAARALRSSHLLASGKNSRLGSGWAIVQENHAVLQLKLAAEGITYDDRTRFEAITDALENWDEQPILFMTFAKKPLPIANLFLTIDLRAVRICEPSGVSTFDYTKEPTEISPQFYKTLYKQRMANAS